MSIFVYLYLGVYPYTQGIILVYPYTWANIWEYVHILMEFYYRVYELFLGEKNSMLIRKK